MNETYREFLCFWQLLTARCVLRENSRISQVKHWSNILKVKPQKVALVISIWYCEVLKVWCADTIRILPSMRTLTVAGSSNCSLCPSGAYSETTASFNFSSFSGLWFIYVLKKNVSKVLTTLLKKNVIQFHTILLHLLHHIFLYWSLQFGMSWFADIDNFFVCFVFSWVSPSFFGKNMIEKPC